MKKRLLAFVLGVGLVISIAPSPAIALANDNLLLNSSFEVAQSTASPADWHATNWGQNDAYFDYTSDARSGLKAAKVTVDTYTDGDAKWEHAAVSVHPRTAYLYSNWYKSTAPTAVWAQLRNLEGSFEYQYLASPAMSSSEWSPVSVTVNVPENIQSMSVFHVVNGVGQLTIDDVSLTTLNPCSATPVQGVPNGGFEQTCVNESITGWQTVQYGTSSASFNTRSEDTYSGAAAVSVTNVDEGTEAGFMSSPFTIDAEQRYELSFWQKSDTYTYAYVAYTLSDDSVEYQSLMPVPATLGEWSKYTDYFIAPENTVSIQLTIATSGYGTVTLDEVALTKLTTPSARTFNEGLVSITFDDGFEGSFTDGFQVLSQHNLKGTFYLNAGLINTPNYMSGSQANALIAGNQEVGSHLYHHSDMVWLDTPTLESELQGNALSLRSILGGTYTPTQLASPYGSFTSDRVNTVMQYASSHRTTTGLLNTKANFDVRQIHGRLVTASTSTSEMNAWLAEAEAQKAWLVLVYHNISDSTTGQAPDVARYNVTPSNFIDQVLAIENSGLNVKTVSEAISALNVR